MPTRRIAWFGDVVGKPGREAFAAGAAHARDTLGAELIVVNGENARHGVGLHPEGYRQLREAGADVVTLGDHALDDQRILDQLADPSEPVLRPANAPAPERAKDRWVHRPGGSEPALVLVAIQGRLFMREGATDPFACVERVVAEVAETDPGALLLIEVHAEATSEKIALALHAAAVGEGRVVAVVGSHTHVPTNDARLIDQRVAALTDLGMCGVSTGVIGFDLASSVRRFRGIPPVGLRLGEGPAEAQGALIGVDPEGGRAVSIEPIRVSGNVP